MDNNPQVSPGNTNDVAGTATSNATGSAPRSAATSAPGSEAASTVPNLAPIGFASQDHENTIRLLADDDKELHELIVTYFNTIEDDPPGILLAYREKIRPTSSCH